MIRITDSSEMVYSITQGNDTIYVNPTNVPDGSHNVIKRAWNSFNGEFISYPVARKVKVPWTFENAVGETGGLSDVMKWIDDRIMQGKEHFLIRTWAPGYGWIKFMAYLGSPTSFTSEGIKPGSPHEPAIEKGELHWIEVGGDGKAGAGDKTIINSQT